jgi:hypothetical protein
VCITEKKKRKRKRNIIFLCYSTGLTFRWVFHQKIKKKEKGKKEENNARHKKEYT